MSPRSNRDLLNEGPVKFAYRISVMRNWYVIPGYREIERNHGLTEPEVSAIFCLGHQQGLRAQDVSNITARPRNSVSRAVRLLIEKKLITRATDDGDRRQKALYLTPSGKRLFKSIVQLYRRREQEMLAPLDVKERALMDAMLRKVVNRLVD